MVLGSENDQIQVIGIVDEDDSRHTPGRGFLAAVALLASLAASLVFLQSGSSDPATVALGTTTTISLQAPIISTPSTVATPPSVTPEGFLVKINIVEDEVRMALRQGAEPTVEGPGADATGTCLPGDRVIATYNERLIETPTTLTNAWLVASNSPHLDSWYFISTLVLEGPTDGQIATWAIPAFNPAGAVDIVNTPGLSIPANEVSLSLNFGTRRVQPGDYGVDDWMDLDGAGESQQCVIISNGG